MSYEPYEHKPRNPNHIHRQEREEGGFNQKIATWLSDGVGTMVCAYLFAALALVGFPGLHATLMQFVQWLSQTFIQLVMLSVLAVSQKVIEHKQELQADEEYERIQKIYADAEMMIKQNNELIKMLEGAGHGKEV